MASAQAHYDDLLSEIYTWLFDGIEIARKRNLEFFNQNGIIPANTKIAIDLGAGSGFQTIPLAEIGYSVIAIDLNARLLNELKENANDHDIAIVQDDLMNFQKYCASGVDLVVCMSDTLAHLISKEDVISLFNKRFSSLASKGKLILTFRDFTHELKELDRFLPVKSDENRIFTCFLEYEPESVKVHDILYKRINGNWVLMKSFYRKIRLSKSWVEDQLSNVGFRINKSNIENGFVTLIAEK